MPNALILSTLLLAVVLIVSGIAKLREPQGVRDAFKSLRVPAPLDAPIVQRITPWAEIGLGVGIVVLPPPAGTAVAALVFALFVFYTFLIWRAYGAPEPVDCGCFGTMVDSRVTRWTLLRNISLLIASMVAVFDSFHFQPAIVRIFHVDELLWLLGFVFVLWVVFTILHRDGTPQTELATIHMTNSVAEGNKELDDYVRLPIPYTWFTDVDGDKVTLYDLIRDRAALLVWFSTGCGSCRTVVEAFPQWRTDLKKIDVRAVVSSPQGGESLAEEFRDDVLVDERWQVLSHLDMHSVPAAVLLGADGLLAGGPVVGSNDVVNFVADIKAQLDEAEVGSAETDAAVDDEQPALNDGPMDATENASPVVDSVSAGEGSEGCVDS